MKNSSNTLTVLFFGLGGLLLVVGITLYVIAPSLAANSADPAMVQGAVGGAGIAALVAGVGGLVLGFKQKSNRR